MISKSRAVVGMRAPRWAVAALFLSGGARGQEVVLPEKLRQLQTRGAAVTLIDVREPQQFKSAHIEGAVNISKDKIGATELPKGGKVVLYCGDARCPLSHEAAKKLISAGYEDVGVLYGGLERWEKVGHPVSPPRSASVKLLLDIDAVALRARLREPAAPRLLDVRSGRDFEAGHLPGAASIPLETLSKAAKSLGKDVEVVVYDRVAARSKAAVRLLAGAGFRARVLAGGVGAWAMKGYPLEAGARDGS